MEKVCIITFLLVCSAIYKADCGDSAVSSNSMNRFARDAENCIQMKIETDAGMIKCWSCKCGCVNEECLQNCDKKFCRPQQ
uniref:Pacifastin domain-containing protein n=1 Tax=Globodera pallida TaxID=36090 RepID=A0A183BYA7_GLOPA